MKKSLLIGFLFFTQLMSAQSHGNEWIDFNKIYLKVKVYQDGIHRISYSAIQQAGIPVQNISPAAFKLFARQKEQAIWVSGAEDGSFDFGDYIEFIGQKNDGWLDSLMFSNPSDIGNPHYSLVNDTISYFLMWDEVMNGKRYELEQDQDYSSYAQPDYVITTARTIYVDDYSAGALLTFSGRDAEYVNSEGWMSGRFGKGAGPLNKAVVLPTPDAYIGPNAPVAIGRTQFASATNSSPGTVPGNHHIKVFRGNSNEVQLADYVFSGYELRNVNFSMPGSSVTETTKLDHVVIDDLGIPTDQFRLAFAELTYAHTQSFANGLIHSFKVNANPNGSKHYLALSGVSLSNPIMYVRGEESYRLSPSLVDGTLDVVIPNQNSNGPSNVFLYDENEVININEVERVGMNGLFTDYASLQPDSAFIIVTHKSLWSAALTYATYRTNPSRDAVVVDVEELYDQYGGGIPKHALGIRRFLADMLIEWDSSPGHLFLLGKSVFNDIENNIVGSRRNPLHYAQDLVPSYGNPGSDVLFTTGLNGSESIAPVISTGRLSASYPQEVLDYLGKVVHNESADPAIWMKNILHFGGGSNFSEQFAFASYLSSYEAIIEDSCFGGDVHTFLKDSSLPIVFNLSDSISDIIEEGVSILTFFGHAGGGQFDQSIDAPGNLTWGAHPFVIVNSCYSGDIHLLGHQSTSEQYVILPEKGAIAFLASVKQGLSGPLNEFSTELYRQLGYKSYGKSVGQQVLKTMQHLAPLWSSSPDSRNVIFMNLLEGDPSTVIFSHERPDILLDPSSISFSPDEITALVDSFQVHVVLSNIGKTTSDDFTLILERTYPDGSVHSFSEQVNGLLFMDTIVFTIPTDFSNSFGLNTIEVTADLPSNVIPELDNFFNNRASKTLLVTDGAVSPILPIEFAIVPPEQVTLKASTGNPFALEKEYIFQLDTTDLFDSPFFQEFSIVQTGGVLEWQPIILSEDSTVYFWRVSEEAMDPETREWRNSSFQVIEDRQGWGQAHFYQFQENKFNNLIYDRPERDMDFFSGLKNVKVNISNVTTENEYFIDFDSQEYDGCGFNAAFHVAVIDPVTLVPWGTRFGGLNPDHFFGNVNDNGACRNRVERYFIFRQESADQMSDFQNMILDEVPPGYIFLIYTWQQARPAFLAANFPEFNDFFTQLGAPDIGIIDSQVPFIYIGVKDNPELAVTAVGDTLNSIITAEFLAPVTGNAGSMTTAPIGPAQAWSSLYWVFEHLQASDSIRVKVIPLNEQFEEISSASLDLNLTASQPVDLSTAIDAGQFPYLRLQSYYNDSLQMTPALLKRWQVLYEPVPEAALNPHVQFAFESEILQEGQSIKLQTAIQNISAMDMDSLLVNYWLERSDNSLLDLPYPRQDSLRAGEMLVDTLDFSTLGLQGENILWIEVNPRTSPDGSYDQAEQTHINNLGRIPFTVTQDKLNPILDVTFDGEHILDGDLVSARPAITVRLDDENPFLLMDDPADTVYFNLFLTEPNGFQRQLRFQSGDGEELMRFIPADGTKNIAEIEIKPDLIQDGLYRLLVIASDKSGNASGDLDYKISFTVEHASSITEVMNYPNPFTTQTRFVFTLTGVTVPDYMKIEIMTVTGKVVREIFKEELGPIRIGRNITEFAWDGRDEFGDPLGNGVYLYRVIVKDTEGDVELRKTAASTFFKKGFGKMYLMR